MHGRYLKAAPIPECYTNFPQQLAEALLGQQSNGIIYPSVRHGRTCVVCFRPTLVYNVRFGDRLELRLLSGREFEPSHVREVEVE